MKCRFCGKEIADDSSFCRYCGKEQAQQAEKENAEKAALSEKLEQQAYAYIEQGQLNFAAQCIKKLNALGSNNPELMFRFQEVRNDHRSHTRRKVLFWILGVFVVLLVAAGIAGGYYYKTVYLENVKYEKVKDSTDLKVLEAFLEEFPDGKHASSIKSTIKEIKSDIEDWNKATAENTVKAFQDYLDNHSNGAYKDNANSQIESLLWSEALHNGDEASFYRYIEQCPGGLHVDEARRHISKKEMQIITEDEKTQISDVIAYFFNGLANKDETRLLANVMPVLTQFNKKKNATKVDVLQYMEYLHASDVYGIKINITDIKVQKNVIDDTSCSYNVTSYVDINFDREDQTSTTFASMKTEMTITSDMKISSISMGIISKYAPAQ